MGSVVAFTMTPSEIVKLETYLTEVVIAVRSGEGLKPVLLSSPPELVIGIVDAAPDVKVRFTPNFLELKPIGIERMSQRDLAAVIFNRLFSLLLMATDIDVTGTKGQFQSNSTGWMSFYEIAIRQK